MLKLAINPAQTTINVPSTQMEKDHLFLLEGYLTSHTIRNHSARTVERERAFLNKWFRLYSFPNRSFYTWEAMIPRDGRERIIQYANSLLKTEVTNNTIRAQLGILSRYFSYVLEHAYVKHQNQYYRIEQIYNPIDQPVSEYDIPKHSYDGEQRGVPLDPELLYDFFHILRKSYLIHNNSIRAAIRARHYTMAVVAGESGLRAEELLHLELSDLFFKSHKLQTRYAKGTRGSGKRARTTLFPPLARDTVNYFLAKYRPIIAVGPNNYLFPNCNGQLLTYRSINLALAEMITTAKQNEFPVLDHMNWHWFRRIFATRFIERFPHQLSALIELLGHTSPGTVHRYIRHSEGWMDKKIQNILEDNSKWPSIGN